MNKKYIMKYKTFANCEEFVAWQNENDVAIFQIMPLVTGFQGDVTEHGSVDMSTNVTVFVTYSENETVTGN